MQTEVPTDDDAVRGPARPAAEKRENRPPGVGLLVLAFFVPPRLTPERVRYDRRYRTLDKYRFISWFLLLPMICYAGLLVWPFLQAFYYSMTDWTGFGADFNFIGFDNYVRLWNDDLFWDAFRHSVLLLVFAPVITLALGLFFAYMLNAGGRRRKNESVSGVAGAQFYKIVYFFPQVLSVAIIAIIWARVFTPRSGMVNNGLDSLGLGSLTKDDWLTGTTGLWVVMLVLCWSFVGFYVVLFSAAMGAIPKEIYEASLLDGASRGQTFFRVTFPLTWDAIRTGWIYMGIQALDGFALVIIMVPRGGFEVLPTFLYRRAFEGQAGYATSVGVVLFLITLVFALVMLRLGRRDRIEY